MDTKGNPFNTGPCIINVRSPGFNRCELFGALDRDHDNFNYFPPHTQLENDCDIAVLLRRLVLKRDIYIDNSLSATDRAENIPHSALSKKV